MDNILSDFANIDEFTRKVFWAFLRKHNLPLSDPFTEEFDLETLHFKKLKKELLGEDSQPYTSLVDIEIENLTLHQPDYIDFLDGCADGKLDLDFANRKYKIFRERNLEDHGFRASRDPWNPDPVYISSFRTVEQLIAFHGLIRPLMEGEGRIFSRVKRCEKCLKFFIAERSDAKFCGIKCRNAYHRHLYKIKNGYIKTTNSEG